jgi:predicted transcriptional regulator
LRENLVARRQSSHPTELELEILHAFWRDGSLSVRQVCDALSPSRKLTYTSVHTIMEIMVAKGYLSVRRRPKSEGGNLYTAKVAKAKTASQMLHGLSKRLFGGSIAGALQNLIRAGEFDRQELDELHKILREEQEKKRP